MTILSEIKACVFDAYGTLFDVHSSVNRHRDRLGDRAAQISSLWRQKQLEYSWLRSLMHRHVDFWQVTTDALDYAFDAFDIDDAALKTELLDAYRVLDCYPEVPEVLQGLKSQDIRTAILSNGSPDMLQAAIEGNQLASLVDNVLTIEEVGIYKPHPSVYQLAVDRLGLPANHMTLQSSNNWDIAGAGSFGMKTVWINRFAQPLDRLGFAPDATLESLDGLLERVL